jgi:CheY-like chemotaxis protein
LLAGRKLLLADDSVTIQKVIDLTFADEGVRVVAFGNGQEAIDHLEGVAPDIVLADVFMPAKNGYEVCRYIKENEKLKHIPVMLLVGSFEPFDEAEARRVGADDILTKPFQSIRRLIDRVGALVTNRPPDEQEVPTAELPKPHGEPEEPARLTTEEIRITTADTRDLSAAPQIPTWESESAALATAPARVAEKRETPGVESYVEGSDTVLDVGELEPIHAAAEDDAVLELDIEVPAETPAYESAGYAAGVPAFIEPQVSERLSVNTQDFGRPPQLMSDTLRSYEPFDGVAYEDQVHELVTTPSQFGSTLDTVTPVGHRSSPASVSGGNQTQLQLSQEMIDTIARRAVEMLSEKVVQEIAWEVVPELAELLIKRRLEEKESKPR